MDMRYCIDPDAEEPIMLINRHIGFDEVDGYGIMGDVFQEELMRLDTLGKKVIKVLINSVGGSVLDGYNIFNAILHTKTKVDTYCIGMAASIAAVIFQAGRRRYMYDYGILMYHNPFGGTDRVNDVMRESIISMIAGRCQKDRTAIGKIMDRETFYTAEEAKEAGLTDEIEASNEYNRKKLMPVVNDARAYFKEANLILNSILKPVKNMSLLKVTNRLKLVADASEDSILESITAIENRATAAEARVATAEAARVTAEGLLLKSETEKQTAIDGLKAVQDKATADALVASTAAATSMVDAAIAIGKLDVKVKDAWIKQAIADPAGTKLLIDGIAITKNAVKLPVNTGFNAGGDDSALPSVENAIAQDMGAIMNRMK